MKKQTIIPDFVQDDSFRVRIEHDPPADLTGAVFDLTLKAAETDTTAALLVSHTIGADAEDAPTLGIAHLTVSRTDSSAIAPGVYLASIQRTLGTDTVTIARTGKDGGMPVRVYKTLNEKVVE